MSGDLSLATRTGWPAELRLLVEKYPRSSWPLHANLGETARFWIARHDMFRKLGGSIAEGNAAFREGRIAARVYADWLAPRLQFYLGQLEEHHVVEDEHYFPIFRKVEPRLFRGFETLDQDHHHLHQAIAANVTTANAFLATLADPSAEARKAAAAYADSADALLTALRRHLDDEEDLIIPVILDRTEEALFG